jgi:queuine/archaeosine tRNA-ribosyltransferase
MASPFSFRASARFLTRSSNRKHALFTTLGLRRTQMESPVQLSIFPGLPRSSCERICQMFFERFNVAGFSILERPMAQMYSQCPEWTHHRFGVPLDGCFRGL